MKGLSGKVAIVTGGATLIGAAVVDRLRADGAKVAVFDIDVAAGEHLASEGGDTLAFWPVDIADDAQVEQAMAAVKARFGGVNLLVNLACTYVDDGAGSGRVSRQHGGRRRRAARLRGDLAQRAALAASPRPGGAAGA